MKLKQSLLALLFIPILLLAELPSDPNINITTITIEELGDTEYEILQNSDTGMIVSIKGKLYYIAFK